MKYTNYKNYKNLVPIYVDDRGWSLSRHPGNYGKFTFDKLSNDEFKNINEWVELQRIYIQSLSLDTKAAILLFERYPRIYDEDVDNNQLLNEEDDNIKELFEIIPSKEIIKKYKYLISIAILNAPKLPFNIILYSKLYKNMGIVIGGTTKYPSFIYSSFVLPHTSKCMSDMEEKGKSINVIPDFIIINMDQNIPLLYMDAGFNNGNKVILPIDILLNIDKIIDSNNINIRNLINTYPTYNSIDYIYLNKETLLDNDTIFYENAKKETLEETMIDISNTGKIVEIVDYPLYKQKEYCKTQYNETYVLVPTSRGVAGSGIIFICKEDKTILFFQRSFLGDFGGTWATVGGAIGEIRVPVYKSKFIFRTYIINISLDDKKIWGMKNLPKLNHEHLTYHWFNFEEILSQLSSFGNFNDFNETDRITKFLRAYTSQIPLALTSFKMINKIFNYGKYGIYLKNPISSLYELVLPGTSYTLWKIKYILN